MSSVTKKEKVIRDKTHLLFLLFILGGWGIEGLLHKPSHIYTHPLTSVEKPH